MDIVCVMSSQVLLARKAAAAGDIERGHARDEKPTPGAAAFSSATAATAATAAAAASRVKTSRVLQRTSTLLPSAAHMFDASAGDAPRARHAPRCAHAQRSAAVGA